MADTHEEWLRKMDEQSLAKQQSFIDGISAKLRRSRPERPPAHPYRGAPDYWRTFEWTMEERIERFGANFRAAGGHVERLANMEQAKRFIADKAEEMSTRTVVRQGQAELDALNIEEALPYAQVAVWNTKDGGQWKARAAEADFGIVVADYAVAYTGSITVLSSKNRGRSVSLLPTVLFAIIPADRLKTRLGEPLMQFDAIGREQLPAGIHFISGPSRSADIENDLTIGVHGPGVVYALLVG